MFTLVDCSKMKRIVKCSYVQKWVQNYFITRQRESMSSDNDQLNVIQCNIMKMKMIHT